MTEDDVEDKDANPHPDNVVLPLPNIGQEIMQKVIEFCEQWVDNPYPKFDLPLSSADLNSFLPPWYVTYISVSEEVLQRLILAANYLDIPPLLQLSCAKAAADLKRLSSSEIEAAFDQETIKLTSREADLVQSANRWADKDATPPQ